MKNKNTHISLNVVVFVLWVVYDELTIIMSSAKRKAEKPNSEITVMQIFSKALTGGSEWYDKVNMYSLIHSSVLQSRIQQWA